jgi:hypothetical protein
MTQQERQILGPLARRLREANPRAWSSLKHETQFGPEFSEFPYYPAALELQEPAQQMIGTLNPGEKALLLESWRSTRRLLHLQRDEEILNQYAVVLVDLLVQRARQAGARTGYL